MLEVVESQRKKLGLTQEEVADKAGISRQYYNAIVHVRSEPTITVAKKLADVLGLGWTNFFCDSGQLVADNSEVK